MAGIEQEEPWWSVVKTLADYVVSGHSEEDIGGHDVRTKLLDSGYQESQIAKAYEWIEKVTLSGSLSESLSMLGSGYRGPRISNPIESAMLSGRLWRGIQACRSRGLLSDDLIERLLDGMRLIDTRDWDDEDVDALLVDMLQAVLRSYSEEECVEILNGAQLHLYC